MGRNQPDWKRVGRTPKALHKFQAVVDSYPIRMLTILYPQGSKPHGIESKNQYSNFEFFYYKDHRLIVAKIEKRKSTR